MPSCKRDCVQVMWLDVVQGTLMYETAMIGGFESQ
jgi:hypothetical protein